MPVNFTESESKRIEQYVQTLEPVKEATVIMSSESSSTLSQHIPIIHMLKKATLKNTVNMEIDLTEDLCESEGDVNNDLATLLSDALHKRNP